jgi:hypothetical protein
LSPKTGCGVCEVKWLTIAAMATSTRTTAAAMAARKVSADGIELGISFTLRTTRDPSVRL